jgi:hypothetical protein
MLRWTRKPRRKRSKRRLLLAPLADDDAEGIGAQAFASVSDDIAESFRFFFFLK